MQKKKSEKVKLQQRRGSGDLLNASAGASSLKRSLHPKRAHLLKSGVTVDLGDMPSREAKASSLNNRRLNLNPIEPQRPNACSFHLRNYLFSCFTS